MIEPFRLAPVAVVLLLGLVPCIPGATEADPEAPAVITTDSAEYCETLADQADQEVLDNPPPPDVMALMAEGRAMCSRGQLRGGILRLRRVLMILHAPATR